MNTRTMPSASRSFARVVFPFPAALDRAVPVTEMLVGWHCDISAVRSWDALPAAARRYVEFLEERLGCPIRWISVGAERDAYLIR